jgi:CheY-like chemotaxis protein
MRECFFVMTRPVFDPADKTFSGEERLANLLAQSRGMHTALQTLLQSVRSYCELIEDDVEDRPGAAAYLASTRQMLDRGLLWLDTFQRHTQAPSEFEKIDLKPLLEGVVQRCRKILPAKVDLQLEFDTDPVIVDGAVFQLQDTLLETLQNCVERLGPEADTLTVRVDHCQFGAADLAGVRCRCVSGLYAVIQFRAGPVVPFRLADCVGFWDGMLRRRADDPAGELRLLHGFGVFLGHGGDLLFSREPTGLLLAVALPAEAKRKDMQVEPNLEDEALYGTETILLVDDEDMIWDVIIDMLQELGYSVILAGNGLDAVEIYRDNPGLIDLVMLDMVMPELDGHGAFFRLKEIDPNVRVLLSSGYVSEEDARDVLDAGAVGFLQKPYRMVDLARKIRSIFATPQP